VKHGASTLDDDDDNDDLYTNTMMPAQLPGRMFVLMF
jgi:hypothetical protein